MVVKNKSFKICNINILIKKINLKKEWMKFFCEIKEYDVYIEGNNNLYRVNGLEHFNLKDGFTHLIFNNSDVMVCKKKWNSAIIVKSKLIESIDAFTLQLFYSNAIKKNIILIHSSLIEYNGKGIMFLGPSGIGKTTQAELWHRYFDSLIINGDCVFVEDKGDHFIGWGTPWHGSSSYCENTSVQVVSLIVLKQGEVNKLRKLESFQKVNEIGKNIIYPMWLENGMDLALDILDHLLQKIPVYELMNRADKESVELVKQEIFGDE